jgi:hypothetical protein
MDSPLDTAAMDEPPPATGISLPYRAPRTGQPSRQLQLAPMSVIDMRSQILANALIVYSNIVHSHSLRFQVAPARPHDIFEVSIIFQHNRYIARLTNRQLIAPAVHVTLLVGDPQPSVQLALSSLLDLTCAPPGTGQANILEGQAETRPMPSTQEDDRSSVMACPRAPVVLGHQNTAEGSSLSATPLTTTGQDIVRQPPASATATSWRRGSDHNAPASAASQARVNGIQGSNLRPTRSIQAPPGDPQTPTRSSRTGGGGGGGGSDALEPSGKVYCTYWIRHGECDYIQQGCLYKHEMPDEATCAIIGFRVVPQWWADKLKADADAADAQARRVQAETQAREQQREQAETQAREQREQDRPLTVDQAEQNEELGEHATRPLTMDQWNRTRGMPRSRPGTGTQDRAADE